MSSEKMIVPDVINVGYQKREGTYTSKLAYVVYTDAKGKLRKEASWDSWCDKQGREEFKNVPTDGFVLNKGVGGGRGWDGRNEYIRVYDPRGFEFEISVANLLFILQETSSIKGKGLEGEFVYSWDRADLVLLPVCSKEYQECINFTEMQVTKVTKNDMIEGAMYQMRDLTKVMYLGRHELYEPHYSWGYGSKATLKTLEPKGKKHIFIDPMRKRNKHDYWNHYGEYIIQTGFTKLAKRLTDEAEESYAQELLKFKSSINGSPLTDWEVKEVKLPPVLTNKNGASARFHGLIKKNDKYYSVSVETGMFYDGYGYGNRNDGRKQFWELYQSEISIDVVRLKDGRCPIPEIDTNYHNCSRVRGNITPEEINKQQFFVLKMKNESGKTFNIIGEDYE